MKILVCGGRDFSDRGLMHKTLYDIAGDWSDLPSVIHGGAGGADLMAGEWALDNWLCVEMYEAEWDKYGKSAGPIRNQRMLDEGKPDIVVAFPRANGKLGTGTSDMIRKAEKAGVRVIRASETEMAL